MEEKLEAIFLLLKVSLAITHLILIYPQNSKKSFNRNNNYKKLKLNNNNRSLISKVRKRRKRIKRKRRISRKKISFLLPSNLNGSSITAHHICKRIYANSF